MTTGLVGAPVQVGMDDGNATPTTLMGQQPSMFSAKGLKNFDEWYPYLQEVSNLCHDVDPTLRQRCAARVEMLQNDIYKHPAYVCNSAGRQRECWPTATKAGPTQPFDYPSTELGERQQRECNALSQQYAEETGCCCNCFAYYSANARGRRLLAANECVCCGFLGERCAAISFLSAYFGSMLCMIPATALDAYNEEKRKIRNRG